MIGIDKYLESQKALSQKKTLSRKSASVSEKSRKSADIVSKKQKKNFDQSVDKKSLSKNQDVRCAQKEGTRSQTESTHAGPSTSIEEQSGSEYAPSSEDEEEPVAVDPVELCIPIRVGTKHNVKKVIDDGDKKMYNLRTEKWKNTVKLLRAEGPVLDESDIQTADVRYQMDGHEDGDEEHEVSGGLRVPNFIWKQLYKYQRSGVKWLWELHQLKSGGLLGDEMGLGKTVQLIAFLAGLSKTNVGTWGGLGPTIIVTPATVIYQWVSHFHYWFPGLRVAALHNSGSHGGKHHHSLIRDLHDAHGILLMTYAGVVRHHKDLMNRNWHYVVLDEGHKIRNPDTQVSKIVKKFTTPHKILITGSPMQNSLQELWSLFDFMSPGLLGTQATFIEYFAVPITQGGYSNATQLQEVTAFEIAKSLKNMITPYMIRRTKAEVQEHIQLPEKNEQVLFCSLSQEQRDLYLGYLLSNTVRSILDREQRFGDPLRARILVAISTLRKICNHPDLYLYEAMNEDEAVIENNFGHWRRSGKMTVVQSLLKIWQRQGHRALIFSQSRTMLCILENFLLQHDYKYLKMDGTVSVGLRQNMIKTFNEKSEYLVFLATTRVGGLGVNLTGADRVIIYDPDWNPATDTQAKERAWRIGQLRNVTIYRLLSAGTIEEKIYQRQIFKHLLGNKVLIDPNQKNPLKTSHLQGLFTLEEPNRDGDTETASIFSHTKVGVGQKDEDKLKNIHLSGAVSFSMKKMAAMRKMARKISRKIGSENAKPTINARERYKTQRELLLNPPIIEEPEINTFNDLETETSFEAALSEIDIINLHSKKDYLEKLLKTVAQDDENNEDISETVENIAEGYDIVAENNDEINYEDVLERDENIAEDYDIVAGNNDEKNNEDISERDENIAHYDIVAENVYEKNYEDVSERDENKAEEYDGVAENNDEKNYEKVDNTENDIEVNNVVEGNKTVSDLNKISEKILDVVVQNQDEKSILMTKCNEDFQQIDIVQENVSVPKEIINTGTSYSYIEEENQEIFINKNNTKNKIKTQSKKRTHAHGLNDEIECLVAVKKLKKKHKEKQDDDDYVLSKLFAKSGVQSALEHDKIVGLAEKEERHRLKEEAGRKAKEALRALRKSVKKNRNY